MHVARGPHDRRTTTRREGPFTGEVWGHPFLAEDGVAMSTVFFAPSSRTYWHKHHAGQVLYVTAGEGLIGTRDGQLARVRVGDVIWTPAGEEHWHGAAPDTFLVHDTASFGGVEWLEELSDEAYGEADERS